MQLPSIPRSSEISRLILGRVQAASSTDDGEARGLPDSRPEAGATVDRADSDSRGD